MGRGAPRAPLRRRRGGGGRDRRLPRAHRHPRRRLGIRGWLAVLLLGGALASPALQAQAAGGAREEPGTVSPFAPDTVLRPPGGPEIVHLPAPGSPLVAMRLSIPVREGVHEAGAGRILQRLGEARARGLATPTGARVSVSRTPWSITYTVVGPATDVDYLAFLLRRAVARPGGDRTAFRQIRSELEARARARSETPGGRILAELRERVAPESPPLGGTLATLQRITRGDIRSLWARTHQASRMHLVVSGSVPLEVLLVSFQDMGAPGSPAPDPVDRAAPSAGRPRTQVLRRWYGEARTTPGIRDPRAELATLLVAETLREAGDPFESEVQLLELPDRKLLAVLGAAYARNRSAMRRRVSTALDETLARLSPGEVERVRESLRADLLTRARTPEGRVEFVGRHLDATGDPGGAVEYMEALARVSASSLEAFLSELAAREPATAEVRP